MVKKQSVNKKIKNATPTIIDDIKFRSKLEVYTYEKLKEANINVSYESKRYILIDGFIYENKKIRPITYLPDFVGNSFIIECKGFPNDSWALREKLIKRYITLNEPDTKFYMVHNKKEVDELIKNLQKISEL